MKQMRSIDLFAGIGGIRLGFERAFGNTLETVFVSEWDKHAQTTYKTNFNDGIKIAGDITEISETNVPEFDICLAGFPCQAFSLAGQRKGFDDDYKGMARGTLFFDVVRICEEHKPKVVFCENVKGLTIHDKGRTYNVIKKSLEEIGYTVHEEVLNSRDFGVPQNRERIYIVAFRNDINSKGFKFPEPTDSNKCIKDIIEEKPVSAKYYLSETYIETLRKHRARHEAKGNGFGYEIRDYNDVANAIVCGGMGRERNLLIDKRQKKLTPVTHIKGEINKEGIRKMTPREWARLQGYPDSYQLPLADVHLYKQLGNSVSVPVIEAIAKRIKEILENQKITVKKSNKEGKSNMLVETGIVKGNIKSLEVFNSCISNDFTSIPAMKPSEYVNFCWVNYNKYCKTRPQNNTMNGYIFELIIKSELYRQSLCPMFLEAELSYVHNVYFDVLLYSYQTILTQSEFPIGLSLKTSLRERYKQADLEALALKNVHKNARNYLITLNESEARIVNKKIEKEEMFGLNKVVVATSTDFDDLINELKGMRFKDPGMIKVIKTGSIVVKN
jgi:DNA (cytosine-5)-methyltransferase 1